MQELDRRKFLQIAGGTAISAAVAAAASRARASSDRGAELELRAWTATGQALPTTVLNQLFFLDLNDEPMPNPPRRVEPGRLFSQPPQFPFAIVVYFTVRGFGNVALYADNQGQGYRLIDFPLNLNLACARSRIHRVRTALEHWRQVGSQFPDRLEERLRQAEANLRQAETTTDPILRARLCNKSLCESLWAGEEAVFAQAQQQIRRQGPRPDFLFGCNFFNHPQAGSEYDHLFKSLFNFATVPLYWHAFEAKRGHPNFVPLDQTVNWLRQADITPKGHPLAWFHEAGVPDWIRGKSYDEVRQLIYRHASEITAHYGNQIPYYDIINEAHDIGWANELSFSQAQFLEITRIASEASHSGNPQVKRIINNCCLWGEYVARAKEPQRLHSAYQYLKTCIVANIPFEFIGFQLYYPSQDMFEINRLLDRFSQLGKPIHITELGVSSATKRDDKAYLQQPEGLWHQPWSEAVQADWIEQFYTLCYSKPYIHAISWWDFADQGNFWPHGGLLKANLSPKKSYYRLKALIDQWCYGAS